RMYSTIRGMDLLRSALLAASNSTWLQSHATELLFFRKGVRRFMPGEGVDDALDAVKALAEVNIGGVLTELGEAVNDASMADDAARHYDDALARINARALDCDISIKLTHFGCAIDADRCLARARSLVQSAQKGGRFVWIDMEQYSHLEVTLQTYRRLVAEFKNVGICLQAYLHRTATDLDSLVPLGAAVRLVQRPYR